MTLGLRAKFILVTIAILTITMGVAAFTSSWVFSREYSNALRTKALVVGENLRNQLDRLLSMGIPIHELIGFDKQCQDVVDQYEDISYAMVVDTEGKILFHSNASRHEESISDPAVLEALRTVHQDLREHWQQEAKNYDVFVPVFGNHREHVATVRLGLPIEVISQRVNQLVLYLIMTFLLSVLFAVCLVIISSYIWISRPLGKLLSVIGEIIQSGPGVGKRVEIRSKDEIGRLASAFNQMITQLNQSHEEVTRYSEVLELKVQERTARLVDTNIRLQQDILERQRVEAALRESEERFRIAAESASDLIYEWDIETDKVEWFGNVDEKLGYLPGQLSRTRAAWMDLIHPDDRDRVMLAFEKHLADGDDFQQEYRIRPREGHFLHWTDRGRALYDDRIRASKFIGVTTDITQRRLAEDGLRESERRFRELADLLPQPVFETDAAGNLTFANHASFECFGFSQEDFYQGINLLDLLVEGERSRAKQDFFGQFPQMKPSDQEYTALRKDGTLFPVLVSSSPVFREGHVAGLRGIIIDLRERKTMEEELARIKRLEALGILAGGMAHDFNNIMAAILGNISLAKMYLEPGGNPHKLLAEAEKATNQARSLTQQLTAVSSGGIPSRTPQSIKEILEDAIGLELSDPGIEAELRSDEDLWPVDCDLGQINQAILNLIVNAREAMPAGGKVEVEATNEIVTPDRHSSLRAGRYVRLSIRDHGVGISSEILPRIFDPYFSTKQRGSQKGMGLGLTVCYAIVKKHDGDIWVESEKNVGTTIHVFLPASSQEAIRQEPVEKVMAVAGSWKVLVMDDEKALRDVTELMLAQLGYDVESAGDGAEAIEKCERAKAQGNPFDLVVLDLTVYGGIGGREALPKLRQIDPSVKAIVLTGHANDPAVADFERYGFDAALVKPFQFRELNETVKKILTIP